MGTRETGLKSVHWLAGPYLPLRHSHCSLPRGV
jgi:hypothetical protein